MTLVAFALVFAAALLGVLVLTLVGVLAPQARRRGLPPGPGPVHDLLRSARSRALTAVGVACLAALGLLVAASALPRLVGLPYLLVPGVAGILGLVVYALVPPRVPDPGEAASREASLVRRTPVSFLSRGTWVALVLAVVGQAGAVFTGLTGSADDQGRLRAISFATGSLTSSATPYGGWFYAGPLLALDAVFLGVLVLALRRIATTPAIGPAGHAAADTAWRRASCRIVVALATGALLLPVGGLALVSGIAIGNARLPGIARWWTHASQVLVGGGAIAVLAALVALAACLSWALALPRVATRGADAEPQRPWPSPGAGEMQ